MDLKELTYEAPPSPLIIAISSDDDASNNSDNLLNRIYFTKIKSEIGSEFSGECSKQTHEEASKTFLRVLTLDEINKRILDEEKKIQDFVNASFDDARPGPSTENNDETKQQYFSGNVDDLENKNFNLEEKKIQDVINTSFDDPRPGPSTENSDETNQRHSSGNVDDHENKISNLKEKNIEDAINTSLDDARSGPSTESSDETNQRYSSENIDELENKIFSLTTKESSASVTEQPVDIIPREPTQMEVTFHDDFKVGASVDLKNSFPKKRTSEGKIEEENDEESTADAANKTVIQVSPSKKKKSSETDIDSKEAVKAQLFQDQFDQSTSNARCNSHNQANENKRERNNNKPSTSNQQSPSSSSSDTSNNNSKDARKTNANVADFQNTLIIPLMDYDDVEFRRLDREVLATTLPSLRFFPCNEKHGKITFCQVKVAETHIKDVELLFDHLRFMRQIDRPIIKQFGGDCNKVAKFCEEELERIRSMNLDIVLIYAKICASLHFMRERIFRNAFQHIPVRFVPFLNVREKYWQLNKMIFGVHRLAPDSAQLMDILLQDCRCVDSVEDEERKLKIMDRIQKNYDFIFTQGEFYANDYVALIARIKEETIENVHGQVNILGKKHYGLLQTCYINKNYKPLLVYG